MMTDALHRPTRSAPEPGSRKSRSLAPREHGAYGQLALPLLVAHLSGPPTVAAWLLTVGAVAAFVAHEPLLVALGRRGARARDEDGRRARRVLLSATAVAVAGILGGALLAPPEARFGLLGCALLAVLVGGEIARDQERSLTGELLVAATLPAVAVPVALCAGVSAPIAIGVWLVWTLGSAAATFAVRDTIAQFKTGRPLVVRVVPVAAVLAAIAGAATLSLMTPGQLVATVPMAGASLLLALRPPHPRHLKRVGWTLVGASVATAAALVYVAQ